MHNYNFVVVCLKRFKVGLFARVGVGDFFITKLIFSCYYYHNVLRENSIVLHVYFIVKADLVFPNEIAILKRVLFSFYQKRSEVEGRLDFSFNIVRRQKNITAKLCYYRRTRLILPT